LKYKENKKEKNKMGKFDDMARILTTARKRHDIRIRKEAEKNRICPMCGSVKEKRNKKTKNGV